MDHNIFISYAWVDNEIFPGADLGWVSTFVDGLRKHLARELGRPEEANRLWVDYEQMRGNQSVTPTILAHLKTSRTLVLILSKGYVASTWCRQELTTFIEKVGAGSGRIFVVQMSPVELEPEELCDLVKYSFYFLDKKNQARTRWFPDKDPTDREYTYQQQTLARDLAVKLRELEQSEVPKDSLQEIAPPLVALPTITLENFILIDGGAEDSDLVYDIAQRLEQRDLGVAFPLSVLPNRPGIKSSDLDQDFKKKLEMCSSIVMVYDNGPGVQVIQHLIECEKARARLPKDHPPLIIILCQTRSDPLALGLHLKDMRIYVVDEPCAEKCVERFLDEFVP